MRGFIFKLVLICDLLFNTASAQPRTGWAFAHSNDKYYLDFDSQRISKQGKTLGLDSIYNDHIEYNTFTLGNKAFSYMYFDSSGKPYILDLSANKRRYIFPRPIGRNQIFQGYVFKPQNDCNHFILFSVNNRGMRFFAWKFQYNIGKDSFALSNLDSTSIGSDYGNGRNATLGFQEDRETNTVWTLFTYYNGKNSVAPINISSTGKISKFAAVMPGIWFDYERGFFNSKYWHRGAYSPTAPQAIISRDLKKCYFANPSPSGSAAVVECDFDKKTGVISNGKILLARASLPREMGVRGLAISPNDSLLYLAIWEIYVQAPMPLEVPYLIQINRFSKARYSYKARGALFNDGLYNYPFVSFMDFGNDGKLYFGIVKDLPANKETFKIGRISAPNKFGARSLPDFDWWSLPGTAFLPSCVGRLGSYDGPFYSYNFDITDNYICTDSSTFRIQVHDTFHRLTVFFGDGDSTDLTGRNFQVFQLKHKYASSGRYPVALRISKPFCASDQWAFDTAVVRFRPIIYHASVTRDHTGCDYEVLTLTDSTRNVEQQIINWGDGYADTVMTGNKWVMKHPYNRADTFLVRVRFSNLKDACSVDQAFNVITRFLPKPDFRLHVTEAGGKLLQDSFLGKRRFSGCNPLTFTIADTGYQNSNITLLRNQVDSNIYLKKDTAISIRFHDSIAQPAPVLNILTLYDFRGCRTTDSIYTQVFETPRVQLTAKDTVICENTSFKAAARLYINPQGTSWQFTNTYLWDSTRATRQLSDSLDTLWSQIPVKPVSTPVGWKPRAFNLAIHGLSPDGCAASANINYRVTSNPFSHFVTSADSLCLLQKISISNRASNLYEPLSRMVYRMGDGSTLEQAGIIDYLYRSPGLYRIRQVVSSTENCMDSSEKTVLIKDFVPAAYATSDRMQCFKGHAFTLADTAAPGQYIVRFGDGSQTGTLPARHQYSRPGQYALQLIKTWNSGCADTQHLKVVIHRNPTASFQVPLLCTGKVALLKNTSTAGDTVFTSTWQTSDSGTYITRDLSRYFTHAGTWQAALQLSDANGCRDSVRQTVMIHPSPEPVMFIEGSSYDQVQGYRYSFFTRPDTFVQYSWSLGTAGTSDMANPRGWFRTAGNAERINLTVKNKSGCAATTDTTLVVKGLTKYLFPSAFTPNGDNKNEGFGIAGPEYVKTYKLWIFNRWGEQVFYTENPNELWQPSKMQTGMYVYKAKVQDLYSRWEEVHGTVMLMR